LPPQESDIRRLGNPSRQTSSHIDATLWHSRLTR